MNARLARAGLLAVAATAVVLAMILLAERSTSSLVSGSPAGPAAWTAAVVLLLASAALPGTAAPVATACLALAWSAPVVVGWHDGPDQVRSVAAVVLPLAVPALLALGLADTRSRPDRVGRTAAIVTTSSWVTVGVLATTTALVRDPFLVPDCWNHCVGNVFLLVPSPAAAAAIEIVAAAVTVVLAVAAASIVGWRVRVTRRPPSATTVLATLALLVVATMSTIATIRPPDAPPQPTLATVASLLLAAMALAGLGERLRLHVARRAVDRIASDLVDGAALRTVLAARLGDPDLVVLFADPAGARLVDAEGHEHDPPSPGRRVTEIRRGDDVLAIVVHGRERSALDGQDVQRLIGGAARLAIDNERLRASIRANLRDVRRSRLEVIDAGDSERMRIERNLHDGAQQTLLALAYELGRAARVRPSSTSDPAQDRLEQARAVAERLRAIAHGVWPAVLGDLGLGPALERLAEDSDRPLRVDVADAERFPPVVERTAYLAVANALDDGADDGRPITVTIRPADDRLRLVVDGAGDPGQVVRDRVVATGGRIDVRSRRLEVELPCA